VINEQDLHEAIAECQGERNPNAQTCIKLAAYYTILNQITEKTVDKIVEPIPMEKGYSYKSESEFYQLVKGKSFDEVLELFDEVMEAVAVYNPRLYDSIIRKL
jgi:hypothetical protein